MDPLGRESMCNLCVQGKTQNHFASRRNFLIGTVATGVAATALSLFASRPAVADDGPPDGSGRPGRRYVIRNGYVMTMDPQLGEFVGDVLIEGKKILAIGPNLHVDNAAE